MTFPKASDLVLADTANKLNRFYDKLGIVTVDEYLAPPKGKFAPVAPYHIYQQFVVNGYLPSTVLLLAHDVVAHKKEYEETFSDPSFEDTTIIMDNSLVELKQAVDSKMVFEAAEAVSADIVVLPDVMGNGYESAAKTLEHWDEWNWLFRDYQKMVVFHGKSMNDWMESATTIARGTQNSFDWVALPRKLEEGPNSKYSRRDYLRLAIQLFPNKPVHLLGFSDYAVEDLWCASNPNVMSIDSAVPLRASVDAILSGHVGPRGNWWETAKFEPDMIDNCRKINSMISKQW